jgi:hypothetical protein
MDNNIAYLSFTKFFVNVIIFLKFFQMYPTRMSSDEYPKGLQLCTPQWSVLQSVLLS